MDTWESTRFLPQSSLLSTGSSALLYHGGHVVAQTLHQDLKRGVIVCCYCLVCLSQ